MSEALNDSEFFRLTREQIQEEDSLINHRMTWLLSLQAFLFAAYGFSLTAESNISSAFASSAAQLNNVQHVIINARIGFAFMAFFSSAVLLCGVAAAALSMLNLTKQWEARLNDRNLHKQYPQIIGTAVPILGIWGGLAPTYVLPITTALVWAWLIQDQPWWAGIGIVGVLLFSLGGGLAVWAFEAGRRAGRG